MFSKPLKIIFNYSAQSAGAEEYTDCISAEGEDPFLQRVSWIWL